MDRVDEAHGEQITASINVATQISSGVVGEHLWLLPRHLSRVADAGVYGGRQETLGSVVNRATPGADIVPEGCINVAPVQAGSAVIITEATLHGVLPYMGGAGRCRSMIVLGYEPQYTGSVPADEEWMANLSEQTKELMEYGHISHTKKIAMAWRREAFISSESISRL